MTDQKITVEQLMEVARTMSSTETLRRKLEKFAAQQRADAVQQLQRENAETAKSAAGWMKACVESNTKLHDLCSELAAANECARINAENSHYWHGEAIAAKQQIAELIEFTQEVRRSGDTRLASMAIAILNCEARTAQAAPDQEQKS